MVVPNSIYDENEMSGKNSPVDALGLTIVTNLRDHLKGQTVVENETQPKSSFKLFFKRGTDMKLRLGFLKRRHTEGQITSQTTVRPSPEEAKKWAESFQSLMASKYGQCLFKAFLRREFSHENIEFWIAIEEYRKARQRKLGAKAQKIINEFVISQAPREVNLDSSTKDGLINVTNLAQADYNTFDQAQKRIQGILEADAYVRFLQSDLFQELIHPEKYSSQILSSPTSTPPLKNNNKSSSLSSFILSPTKNTKGSVSE